jgi:beta-galactosidase
VRCAPAATTSDPYLHDLYDRLHDSPMQRKLRRLRPWPGGVVFVERPGMTLEEIRGHFRQMRELGFSCLKQCQLCETTDARAVYHAALDEGIIPYWYDDAGSEESTPELLKKLGITETIDLADLREHPAWRRRQMALLRAQIDAPAQPRIIIAANETDGLPGTLKRDQYGLPPEARNLFVAWLKARYKTVAALKEAWNFHYAMVRARPWKTWRDVTAGVVVLVNTENQDYRRMMDVLRFRADAHLEMIRKRRDEHLKANPLVPARTGGEMSLFLPFAARATDMEGIAETMAEGGSFYPSIHPSWHYEEADFEYLRPNYMQAALAVDWFKGGWAASWESTGGPQQLSGGKAPFVENVRDKVAGFTIDENTIQQLMLSWVAAGFKGFGQWCWNARGFGWEAGEYALLDRNMKVCGRTVAAGRIVRACRRLRDELWTAHKEPLVGVFQDWESDATYAALAVGGRDMYKGWPVRARIGAARALIDANVPWEHVTRKNLLAGLADRYRVLLLPAQLAVDEALLPLLEAYVERGGRVVLDAPGAWYNYAGRLLPTDDGTPFERLFGVRLGDYQYSRGNHVIWRLEGNALEGFVLDLQTTRAKVTATFDDGRPAITEHRLGRGAAVVLGFEATLGCWRPGRNWLQAILVKNLLGAHVPDYLCAGALAYRLATPTADHYFLMNDGAACRAHLDTGSHRYARWEDPIAERQLKIGVALPIPAHGARWIRAVK